MPPSKTTFRELPGKHIQIQNDNSGLDFQAARDLAREKVAELFDDAMLLSWYDGKRDVAYPDRECGPGGKPAWILYAESRGGDLSVDINAGEYVFIFLGLF